MIRVLHVVNEGWPLVDGYTIRSAGLVAAQRAVLGIDTQVLTAPFATFAQAEDPAFAPDGWGPAQRAAGPFDLPAWERPAIGLAPRGGAAHRAAVAEAVADLRPDVVHVHHPHYVARPAIAAAHAADVPAVYELRCFNGDYDLDRTNPWARLRGTIGNALEHVAAAEADAVVTIAEGLADRLRAGHPGIGSGRALASDGVQDVHVVRNAVDDARFTPDGPALERPKVDLQVGYATTFAAIEGLDLLVEAVRLAVLRAPDRSIAVTLAGLGSDRDRVRGLVREAGLDDVVTFPGFVPVAQMPAWHRANDLFVLSRHDAAVAQQTTPLKPLEAVACGTPVLATDLPANRELLGTLGGVALYEPTPAALAERLVDAMHARPARHERPDLGDRTWSQEVRRYRDVYASVGCAVDATPTDTLQPTATTDGDAA